MNGDEEKHGKRPLTRLMKPLILGLIVSALICVILIMADSRLRVLNRKIMALNLEAQKHQQESEEWKKYGVAQEEAAREYIEEEEARLEEEHRRELEMEMDELVKELGIEIREGETTVKDLLASARRKVSTLECSLAQKALEAETAEHNYRQRVMIHERQMEQKRREIDDLMQENRRLELIIEQGGRGK